MKKMSAESQEMSEPDLDAIMASLAALHDEIHRDDPDPQTLSEAQAALVKGGLQGLIIHLIAAGCNLRTVELSLFYFWHHLFVKDVDLEHEADHLPLDVTLPHVIGLMEEIAADIHHDCGPAPEMAQVGDLVSQLKQAAFEIAQQPKSEEQHRVDAERVNKAIFDMVNCVIACGVHPLLVQNLLLYFWLRSSTIVANVDEALFQKIERNWVDVLDVLNPAYLAFIRRHV